MGKRSKFWWHFRSRTLQDFPRRLICRDSLAFFKTYFPPPTYGSKPCRHLSFFFFPLYTQYTRPWTSTLALKPAMIPSFTIKIGYSRQLSWRLSLKVSIRHKLKSSREQTSILGLTSSSSTRPVSRKHFAFHNPGANIGLRFDTALHSVSIIGSAHVLGTRTEQLQGIVYYVHQEELNGTFCESDM